jgi:quinol monooxygenase YgiN
LTTYPTHEEILMSVIVVATIFPIPEHRAAVIAAFEEAIPVVHADDAGCELYALHEGDDRLVMIEKWANREALETHSHSAALTALGPRLDGLLNSPPDVQVLMAHPVGPSARGAI